MDFSIQSLMNCANLIALLVYILVDMAKDTSLVPGGLLENDAVDVVKDEVTQAPTVAPETFGFVHAFVGSFTMIVVSEIGDKTFFIAAIMSMKHSRLMVFAGAISALAFMTILSVSFGWIATVIPRAYTYYISTFLFAVFGFKMLREGCRMSPNEGQEEFEEVQSDLRKRDEEFEEAAKSIEQEKLSESSPSNLENKFDNDVHSPDVETGAAAKKKRNALFMMSRVIIQAFTLTFLAEWGDRSQLATIILAARENVYGVSLGGIIGHSLCTGLAVIGGRFIAQKISVRTVTIIGGIVFLIFAVSALIIDPNRNS